MSEMTFNFPIKLTNDRSKNKVILRKKVDSECKTLA